MSKSTPSTSTVTQSNPLGQLQGQFLGGMWQSANAMSGSGDPQNAYGWPLLQGIQNYAQNNYNNTAGLGLGAVPAGLSFVNQALSGTGGYLLPGASQISGLNGMASGAANSGQGYGNALSNAAYMTPGAIAPYATGLKDLSGVAGGIANPSEAALMANSGMAISGNPVFSSGLMGAASGQYIDPSRNPALAGTIQAATQPLVNQYQTATAPQIASNFEAGGRYGSGAQTNAQGQAQYGLGQALSNATSNIVNNAYNTGLNAMLGAGSTLGSNYSTGISNANQGYGTAGSLAQSGISNAGNLLQAGGALDLSSLQAMMSGLNYGAGAVNAGYGTGANALAQGGNLANTGMLNMGSLAQMTPDLANYPMSQLSTAFNSAWAPIQNYASLLGQPIGGNTTTTQTQPYYSNVGSSLLSRLTGIASLASKI